MSDHEEWEAFPYPSASFNYAGAKLAKAWDRLHAGDREPYPDEARIVALFDQSPELADTGEPAAVAKALADAWRAYHRGDFQAAFIQGSALGAIGASVAIKAGGIHAAHLIDDDGEREARFAELVTLAESAIAALPDEANSHFRHAFALGRYSQCISIAKALTQGLAGKTKASLDQTLALEPEHAEAHTALGLYHAEIVSRVGSMIAGLTYGAKAKTGEALLKRAIELTPDSPIAHIEYGNGLLLLFGDKREDEAAGEYEIASALKPLDAMDKLDIEFAASHLE